MKLLSIFYLTVLIFLRLIARNEGRTLTPKSEITTEFTEVISENGQINEGNIPQNDKNIKQDDESRRLKYLMEALLLKGGNNSIVKELLPPNYNEREFMTGSEKTATQLSGDKTNLTYATNEALSHVQPQELTTNATRERFLNRMRNADTVVELSTNKTNFDDRELALNISENFLSTTHNGNNHTAPNATDVSERHATISLHIYSTREQDGSDDHPIDRLSMDAKHIGNKETLKQQLDFLQKNAENIKKQQHIVGDNGVYIVERDGYNAEVQTGKVDVPTSNVATSYNKKVNPESLTNVSPELPMLLVQPNETNGEPGNSYAVPNLNSGSNTISKASTTINKEDQQTVPLNVKVKVKAELYSSNSHATQSVYSPTHTYDGTSHPSLLNDSQKLSKPLHQSNVIVAPTESSQQAEMSLSGHRNSEQQEYGIHSVTENQPSNYNSGSDYYTLSYETLELPKPQTEPFKANQPPTSPIEPNLSSTKPIISETKNSSTSFALNENLSQSSEVIYNLGYKDPQKTDDIFIFEPSEPISYLSASSNTFNTANIYDAFERLTEIFEQYSVPISSVVKQLSDGYESTQENAISPTRSRESEKVPNTQALTEKHERPYTRVDGITYDGPDFVEFGYGSGYKVLPSKLNFLNFNRTKDAASDENSSEECNGMCAEDSEGEAPESFNQPNQPIITYQTVESGESNESEFQLNDPSATEYNNVNGETTNPAETTETKLSTTKVMTLFNGTYPIAAIANEPANNLEHLEVAIENDKRKGIENIDKTNETQVATIHQQQQQQHFAVDTELLAENTNDESTWATAGLQHISQTLLPQPDTTTNVAGAKGERIRLPKPEVMCSKTEIIKSEQYSKTNESGNETENENEVPETVARGRVLLGRSLSYTISCHIRKPEQPAAVVRVVQAANITDEIDNNRQKIIKNHAQLTITSADDSRNGLPLQHRGAEQPVEAEPIERRTEMDSSGNKASDGAADEGVGTADTDGSGYCDSAEGGTESEENYYTAIGGNAHEIDGDGDDDDDGDGDIDVDGYVSSAASLHAANGIQSRVRQPAAMTAVAQLTTSLETDNDKTYEYDTRQPLRGGLSDKDVNFESVEHVAASKNTKQMDSSVNGANKDYPDDDDDDNQDSHDGDDSDGNAFIDAVEFVTSDYVTENGSAYREAEKAANMDGNRDGIHVANGADETVGVDDNMLQYKLTKAEADAVEKQKNNENYNAELLKPETESTKLKNASGGVGDANNDASEDDDDDEDNDDDDGKGKSDSVSNESEEMAVGSGITVDAEAEDSSADRMIAVADVTKPKRMLTTSKGRRALHRADTAS